MLERFLELQPAVYATLVSKDLKSKEKDTIATLSEDDITLAENVMTVLVPLRTVTTALCSESMPTASHHASSKEASYKRVSLYRV